MLCTHRTFETFVGNMEVQDTIYVYTCTLPPHMLCIHSSQIAQLDQQPSGLMDAGSDHGSAAKGQLYIWR